MQNGELYRVHRSVTVSKKRSTRSGATRMARLRDRRQRGFRCLTIEYCAADIDRLIRRGYLDRQNRDDPTAVERAIGAALDRL